MIEAVQTALYSLYDAGGDFTTGTPGGFHYMRAPQNTAFAYSVFQWVGALMDQSTFSQLIYETELQVRVFSAVTSQGETSALLTKALTMFNETILTPATGQPVQLLFTRALPPFLTEAVEGATWEGNIYFELIIQPS